MSNLEFRAWDNKNKVMIYFNLIDLIKPHYTDKSFIFNNKDLSYKFKETYYKKFKLFKIMQWTGLKDKNGIKIFEGDILLIKDEKLVIKFDNSVFKLYFLDNVFSCYLFERYLTIECEVIGNIYQNEDLINGM